MVVSRELTICCLKAHVCAINPISALNYTTDSIFATRKKCKESLKDENSYIRNIKVKKSPSSNDVAWIIDWFAKEFNKAKSVIQP